MIGAFSEFFRRAIRKNAMVHRKKPKIASLPLLSCMIRRFGVRFLLVNVTKLGQKIIPEGDLNIAGYFPIFSKIFSGDG